MAEESLGNIGSFFADVQVIFNFDEQYSRLTDQLKAFASSIPPIIIPVRFGKPSLAQLEIQGAMVESMAMGAGGSSRMAAALRREQAWESRSDSSMHEMGYRKGEGGWYKPEAEESEQSGRKSSKSAGIGSLLKGPLGLAGSVAGFMAVFKVAGDLFAGAKLDRQFEIMHNLIPVQNDYNTAMGMLVKTSNLSGVTLDKTTHSFIAFETGAKNAGIGLKQATDTFSALSIAIAGTGSQGQANRIFGDFSHMVLNADKLSEGKIGNSDLGRYLQVNTLLKKENQFQGLDLKQIYEALNKMPKADQLAAFAEAFNTYKAQAEAGMNTVAGRFATLETTLQLLGQELTHIGGPAIKIGLDVVTLFIEGLREGFHYIGEMLSAEFNLIGKGASFISEIASKAVPVIMNGFSHPKADIPYAGAPLKMEFIHTHVDKTSGGVKTSVSQPSIFGSQTLARTR